MSALYGRRVTRWLNKIQFTDFYLIWSFFCSIATSACSVERGRAQWERRKERCDKQQEGQRVKEDISWKQTASLFFFLPFCFFEILFFHHFGWPRFSLFASLFRQCNSRVCCAPQQTVSRGSRIREERETLLYSSTNQPSWEEWKLSAMSHHEVSPIHSPFPLMYIEVPTTWWLTRGVIRVYRSDDVGTRIIKPKPRQVLWCTRPISIMRDAWNIQRQLYL